MVLVSIFSSEKNQKLKKGETIQKIFFITLFAEKNPEREKIRRHF